MLLVADQVGHFRRSLLAWFRRHQRDLPWRHDRDSYRAWVSEIMLQQTQVATVIPYFERFLAMFPTVAHLAAATEQDVLRSWEGLGYYRRARDLHRAAGIVVVQHGGQLPNDPALVGTLPGIGRYTLGAILSQAFDRRLPIVEANSLRVLCRLYARTEDPRTGALRRWLWETAEALLPQKGSGEFNQALMELGALVCTPAAPQCSNCPVARWCAAKQAGRQAEIPCRSRAEKITEVNEVGVVPRRRGKVLLVQRPTQGRWAGLWEFPHAPTRRGETHESAGRRLLLDLTGLTGEWGPELATLRHGVTRFRITMVCFEATGVSGRFRSEFYAQGRWVALTELPAYPVSVPQRKLIRLLLQSSRQRHLF